MSADDHLLILGGGLSGHSTAMAARGNGYAGPITILGDEYHRPYDRTPLSKAVMQGQRDATDLYFLSEDDYEQFDIDLVTDARATAVDFDAGAVETDGRRSIAWDRLMIAAGCEPIRLDQPGFELPGVHYLRRIPDAMAIRDELANAGTVLIIGAGFIGSEVAASARSYGVNVILADMLGNPMEAALGAKLAGVCADIHRDNGVDLRMSTTVTELHGGARVEKAVFSDGGSVACDMVVVGVGVRPNTDLFEDSSLNMVNGIIVDEYCRTSIDSVYAAGDIANWWHPERKLRCRIEHFDNAGAQGTFAGKVIAGATDEPYAPTPYFWSDQYDTNIQYVGFPSPEADIVLRGDPADRAVTGFYLLDGAINAAVTINRPKELRSARRLVNAAAKVEPDVLADLDVDLRKLSREFG